MIGRRRRIARPDAVAAADNNNLLFFVPLLPLPLLLATTASTAAASSTAFANGFGLGGLGGLGFVRRRRRQRRDIGDGGDFCGSWRRTATASTTTTAAYYKSNGGNGGNSYRRRTSLLFGEDDFGGFDGFDFEEDERADDSSVTVVMPLLDVFVDDDDDDDATTVQPLPCSHLPDELTAPNLYGIQLSSLRPVHKVLLEEAFFGETGRTEGTEGAGADPNRRPPRGRRLFGYVAYKPKKNKNPDGDSCSYVGSIGCAAELLLKTGSGSSSTGGSSTGTGGRERSESEDSGDAGEAWLCRGGFRFVVRRILKTVPYPVALVEELFDNDIDRDDVNDVDDDNDNNNNNNNNNNNTRDELVFRNEGDDEDDDYDDTDPYEHMTPNELVQKTLLATKQLVDFQVEAALQQSEELSPLERSILEDVEGAASSSDVSAQKQAAQQAAAVFDAFQSSLADLFPGGSNFRRDLCYAVAMMCAELANVPNRVRRKLLATTDGPGRLRYLLRVLEDSVKMQRARKVAASITDATDDSQKELKVGQPSLPPWSKQIQKGTRLEYYWNEEWGWCPGTVVEEPLKVVDEIILAVRFDSDNGPVQRLPLTAEDKVRWRPTT